MDYYSSSSSSSSSSSLHKDMPASWADSDAHVDSDALPHPHADDTPINIELPKALMPALDWARTCLPATLSPTSALTAAALTLTLLVFPKLFFPLALFALGAGASAAYLYLFLLADNDAGHATITSQPLSANDDDRPARAATKAASGTRRPLSRSASRRASLLRRHSFQHPPPALPGTPAAHLSSPAPMLLIESVNLDLDTGGPLDLAVSTVRDLIIRDFVQSWFATSLAAPGPGAHRFPTAIALSLNTLFMKLKARVVARGTADLLVDLATRAAGDLVAHLRMVHPVVARVPAGPEFHAKVLKVAKSKPGSPVARAMDAEQHAAGVRRVAERLLKGLLPVQDVHSPIVYPIVEEIVCTTVLWPVVNLVSDPHFINGLIVGALEAAPVDLEPKAAAIKCELQVRVIQTRGHNDLLKALAEQDGNDFSITALFRGVEKRAEAHAFGQEGSTPASFVFDSSCPFVLKSPLASSDTAILQLCRSSASGTQAVVAEALVPLVELPHVGWTPFYDLGAEGEDLVPVMELWLELEITESELASASPALSKPAPLTPAASSDQLALADVALAAESELPTNQLPPSPLPSPPSTPPRDVSDDRGLSPAAHQLEQPPRQDLIGLAQALHSLTLETLHATPDLAAAFSAHLKSTSREAHHQFAFLSAANNYAQFTSLLDPADPQSRAAIQQEAYDVFDTYFSSASPVLASHLVQALEERIVLDPTPQLFDPPAKLVGDQLHSHLMAFVAGQLRVLRGKMTDAELIAASAHGDPVRPQRPRSASVSLDDRARWTPELDEVATLAVKHTQLIEGKCSTLDLGFAASCLNTMQMQLVVVERALAHAMMQAGDGADERVSRLMMAKSRVECGLMALEPIVFGAAAGAGFASLAAMDAPVPASAAAAGTGSPTVRAGGIVGGLTSGAQSIKAGVGTTAAKSVLGVKNAIKGVGKGSLSMTSKFMKRKVSNVSLASVDVPSPGSTSPTTTASSVPGTPAPSVASTRSVPASPQLGNSRARLSSMSSTLSASSATLLSSAASSISESGQQLLAKVPSALTSSVESITASSMSVASSVASTLTLQSTAPVLPAKDTPMGSPTKPTMTASPTSASPPPGPALAVSPGTSPTSAVITAVANPATTDPTSSTLSTIQADALIEATLAVLKQVFALDGTLRARIFGIITQVLRPTLASHIQHQFVHLLDRVSDPQVLATLVESALLDPLWPNGTWHANVPGYTPAPPVAPEEKAKVAERARELVEAALPEVVARVLGKTNATQGVRATFGMVQVVELNRGLVVDLLETLAEVVVPEHLD